jgi:hypothetical protein
MQAARGLGRLAEKHVATAPTSQVTISRRIQAHTGAYRRIRDAMQWAPGAPMEFSLDAAGEVVLHPARSAQGTRKPKRDRFDAARAPA